jgi:hypothetical protein
MASKIIWKPSLFWFSPKGIIKLVPFVCSSGFGIRVGGGAIDFLSTTVSWVIKVV